MYEKFYSPNILAVASSLVGEDSLSHHVDPAIGVYIIDRYTYYALEFLEKVQRGSKKTMGQFLEVCPPRLCISTVGNRTDLFGRDPYQVPITDFFGSVRSVELTTDVIDLPERKETLSGDGVCTKDSCMDASSEPPVLYTYPDPLPVLNELLIAEPSS